MLPFWGHHPYLPTPVSSDACPAGAVRSLLAPHADCASLSLCGAVSGMDSGAERTAHGDGGRYRHIRLAAKEPHRGHLF